MLCGYHDLANHNRTMSNGSEKRPARATATRPRDIFGLGAKLGMLSDWQLPVIEKFSQ
jgi:serine phosphatase RsbU (regulator of sigma subunit)